MEKNEIINKFKENIYGYMPKEYDNIKSKWVCLENKSIKINKINVLRKQLCVLLYDAQNIVELDVLLYIPYKCDIKGCIVGLNFNGNHTILTDNNIIKPKWIESKRKNKKIGCDSEEWSVYNLVLNNYAVCTMYSGQLKPGDIPKNINSNETILYKGIDVFKTSTVNNEWGTIYKWAWGLNILCKLVKQIKILEKTNIILYGLSRLGKAALWSSAIYNNCEIVICACSGRGGVADSKRNKIETCKQINDKFPTWFCENYKKFNNNIYNLKIEQYLLFKLIYPNKIYISSASNDIYSDYKGELITVLLSETYYLNKFKKNININLNNIHDNFKYILNKNIYTNDSYIGYHCSDKTHGVYYSDWKLYIDFLNQPL
jgi:hypothetical protein